MGSNMAIDVGTAQVRAPYFVGGRTGVLTGLVAGDVVFAMRNVGMLAPNGAGGTQLVNAPLPISQIRLRYGPTTDATNGVAFEVFKATGFTTSPTGVAVVPQRRKTSQYADIATSEVEARVANTGAMPGAVFAVTALNPLDMAMSRGAILAGCNSIWAPYDLMPLVLEQDEGIIVRVAAFSGTGILFAGVDFGR
jgi:hypothetical protein